MNKKSLKINKNILLVSSCMFYASLSGCQIVKIKENKLYDALINNTETILTNKKLSTNSTNVLKAVELTERQCLHHIEQCETKVGQNFLLDKDETYASLSEIYLAKASELEKVTKCSSNTANMSQGVNSECINEKIKYLDKSLRYSYVYLFDSDNKPTERVFDQRQMQVRTFYNVALSRLITSTYLKDHYKLLPTKLDVGNTQYEFDLSYYPELSNKPIKRIQSSYNLNFSGFDHVNRQDGLGAEFVLIEQDENKINNTYILDPEEYFKGKKNPNIHHAQYLSLTAIVKPKDQSASDEKILSGEAPLKIQLFNPYQYKTTQINQQNYILTANYSVPFAVWLAENKLGSTGYLSLLNRTENLRMPHVYMIEPYQPNKKVIVLVHGLASSPETWLDLTNNILGDKYLRDHYQVWQVFYSTNMPILESRYQINEILKQAFAELTPNTPSTQDAVLVGHSMGGIISRLLVSEGDISKEAIPLLNYEQFTQYQRYPVIGERFKFKNELPFTRAIFIAAPHKGSDLTDRFYVEWVKKLVSIPKVFFEQVTVQLKDVKGTQGLLNTGPDDLSPNSRFMILTKNVEPKTNFPYHSIIGNQTKSNEPQQMTDGIVPYTSSHLANAVSENVIRGGHSIHEENETLLELRRILRNHLD